MSDDTLSETVHARQGDLRFFVNDSGALTQSLRKYGEWAENELTFIRRFISPGSTVLDIGAYIGTHTLAFSRAVGADGHVLAVEAQTKTFDLLQKNVAANGLANVRLEHAAVGDTSQSVNIVPIDITNPESFGSMPVRLVADTEATQTQAPGIEVRMLTIDELQLQTCALIKIDAEGAEDIILKGAPQTLKTLAPVIYAECNSVESGLRSITVLKDAGYDVRLHVVDAFNPHNFRGDAENIFGPAREVALVGIPKTRLAEIDQLKPEPCELILRVEDADDLVLGMLNKPQYPGEVLSAGVAAADGGSAWMDEAHAQKLEHGRVANEAEWAKGELAKTRAEVEELKTEKFHAVQAALQAEDHAKAARNAVEISAEKVQAAENTIQQVQAVAEHARAAAELAQAAAASSADTAQQAAEHARLALERLTRNETSFSWWITRPIRVVQGLFGKRA